MPRYLVTWEMDSEHASSPREAAEQAWAAMRRPGSTANVFTVYERDRVGEGITVDLQEPPEAA